MNVNINKSRKNNQFKKKEKSCKQPNAQILEVKIFPAAEKHGIYPRSVKAQASQNTVRKRV